MKRIGFGQVEPNHLSGKRTGQIYAQLPAAKSITVLENGMFAKYDYENNVVDFDGAGEWMLVLNEVKLYDDAHRYYTAGSGMYAGYAMESKNFMDGEMVPRLIKTNVGDIFTTNTFEVVDGEMADLVVGDKLSPNAKGYLAKDGDGSIEWNVVKVYTMPDGQEGVKLQRVK